MNQYRAWCQFSVWWRPDAAGLARSDPMDYASALKEKVRYENMIKKNEVLRVWDSGVEQVNEKEVK